MKKILTLIVMAAMCLGAAAQLRTSRTVFTQPKVEKPKLPVRMDWYVKAGVSINNMDIHDYMYEANGSGNQFGFAIDGGFNRYFGQSNFYWGAELGIDTRGVKVDGEVEYRDYDSSSWKYERVQSDFMAINAQLTPKVGYMLPLDDSGTALDFHLGGFVSYDFAHISRYIWVYWDDVLQVGAQGGIGIWFNRFNFDVSFQQGFLECGNGDTPKSYMDFDMSRNIRLRVGYAF